ncbi:MAG: trigger factor [Candidatus Electryonea clarkiae]|nr:trigger factor [Candidatus Electryonea clarkiae]MDP8286467.1 trigger factor [Candidatus Electryonea clarkiae]
MKILEQTQEGAVVKVRVEIPETDLLPHFEKAIGAFRKDLKLDGFRQGKVPPEIVKKRFGDNLLWESIDEYIKEIYPKIVESSGMKPITPGDIIDPDYVAGKHLQFTAVFEIFPEFSLDNWKGLKIIKEKVLITDEDIDKHLHVLQHSKAIISEKPADDVAEMGDRLTLNLQELDKAGTIIIGHRNEDIVVDLGKNLFGEGVDDQLLGVKNGETRRLNAKTMKSNEAGKEVEEDFNIEVTITKIEKIDLPEIDDAFASQVYQDISSMDELKARVKDNLEHFTKMTVNQKVSDRLIDKIIEAHPFDVPPSLLNETFERLLASHKEKSKVESPDDAVKNSLSLLADKQLRWHFIKDRLIEDLKLEATDDEIEHQFSLRAGDDEEELKNLRLMFASGDRRDMLKLEIIDGKLMEALVSSAEIDERPMDLETILQG